MGERVLDVPATLPARARPSGSGRSNKNDPNDAYSVVVAALRGPGLSVVTAADHAAVLRLLAKRNKQLGSERTRSRVSAACAARRVGGGRYRQGNHGESGRAWLLEQVAPTNPVEQTRYELAVEHLDDLRRLDAQTRALHRRMADAVKASRTTVSELFGFGPVGTAIAVGYTRDVRRFVGRDHFAAYNGTARRSRCHPAGGPCIGCRGAEPPDESRDPHGRDHPDPSPALARLRVLPTQAGRGEDQERSDPGTEAANQRRARRTARRRRGATSGPGRGKRGRQPKSTWPASNPNSRRFR